MKRNGALQYDYDHNLLLSITSPQYPDANFSYVYGSSSDKVRNQGGRVKQVSNQSGTEAREYGALGEVVKETLTLTAVANGGSTPPVYTTQYDFGRLHRLTLPDGEGIRNAYDSGGNLQSIHGRLHFEIRKNAYPGNDQNNLDSKSESTGVDKLKQFFSGMASDAPMSNPDTHI